MDQTQTALQKIGQWPQRILKALRTAGHAIAREFRLFLAAPLGRTWAGIKALARMIVRVISWMVLFPVLLVVALVRWLLKLTLRQIIRYSLATAGVLVLLLSAGFFAAVHWPHSQVPEIRPPDQIVYQDQGWGVGRDAPDRQTYYYTPQGAGNVMRNMRYDWFAHLELPWGKNRLANPDQMRAYGFQVDNTPSAANPYQLPTGFTRHYDPRLGEEVLDISCAACHTGALLVKKDDGTSVSLRIDGGQAMHAFTASSMPNFIPVLLASMASTLTNPFKFSRFADNVLGPKHSDDARSALRDEFKKTFFAVLKMGVNEKKFHLAPVVEGYARTDALTRIGNAVFGDHITSDNYKAGTAPVSYPPLWDIWKFDWVQYSASVAQPMARNVGESLGVGATYDFFAASGKPIPADEPISMARREAEKIPYRRYDSSSRMLDLHTMELSLRRLRPPTWNEEILGNIDQDKAIAGGVHFVRTCQGCHGPHPAGKRQIMIEMPGKWPSPEEALAGQEPLPHWVMKSLTVQEIGTDPNAAVNFVANTYDLSSTGLTIEEVTEVVGEEIELQNQRILRYDYPAVHELCSQSAAPLPADCDAWAVTRKTLTDAMTRSLDNIDLTAVSNGEGLNYFGLLMKRKLYTDLGFSAEQIAEYNGFDALDLPQVKMWYKARPLAGAWATAPYLHNGSVPNLYQMLSPQHERSARFFIGQPAFDTKQVGLELVDSNRNGFWFDTNINGNANTGHEFRAGYTYWSPDNPPQYGVIGPAYTEQERYELIEYLKVHRDDPPHEGRFGEVFAGIIAQVMATLPAPGEAAGMEALWPSGQTCNLDEYVANHLKAPSLSDELRQDLNTIQTRLDEYFALDGARQCGGKTRFQRGGSVAAEPVNNQETES